MDSGKRKSTPEPYAKKSRTSQPGVRSLAKSGLWRNDEELDMIRYKDVGDGAQDQAKAQKKPVEKSAAELANLDERAAVLKDVAAKWPKLAKKDINAVTTREELIELVITKAKVAKMRASDEVDIVMAERKI